MVRALAIVSLLFCLGGCGMVVAGIIGAAVTPIVQPQVDRGLHAFSLDWIDPAGTQAIH